MTDSSVCVLFNITTIAVVDSHSLIIDYVVYISCQGFLRRYLYLLQMYSICYFLKRSIHFCSNNCSTSAVVKYVMKLILCAM